MTTQQTLPGIDLSLDAMVADAIKLLRQAQPRDGRPYYGCFSGGKDSCVIKELARLAGMPVVWHYNVTTIDPPELVRFIREKHPDVVHEKPQRGFFTWMRTQGFPTRRQRWCCRHLKERSAPVGCRMVFGVRAEESARRAKNWQPVTRHDRTKEIVVSPIVGWTMEQVWEFIDRASLAYCGLYDEGFDRIGCVGCPMGGPDQKRRQFARWPKYEAAWKRGFQRQRETRTGTLTRDGRQWIGDRHWSSWQEMWDWWLNDEPLPTEKHECQGLIELFS
jgi:phosphoadenosine phosphosulfate reductase